jgi:hypothetical protein
LPHGNQLLRIRRRPHRASSLHGVLPERFAFDPGQKLTCLHILTLFQANTCIFLGVQVSTCISAVSMSSTRRQAVSKPDAKQQGAIVFTGVWPEIGYATASPLSNRLNPGCLSRTELSTRLVRSSL